MTKSHEAVEYLEKYSVAPSPSRDYYGIKVLRDQVILYTWKISHGPHLSPIVRVSRFSDFNQDKTMQDEIQRVFGEPIFRHVQSIAKGNEATLLTLPKSLVKKLIHFLTFKDVLKLSTLSHVAKEVFNRDFVWEVLYKKQKMGLVYKDEREQGSSRGWKRLFEDRQMHKPARNREVKKPASDRRIGTPGISDKLTKRPSSSLLLKNRPETQMLLVDETKTRVGGKAKDKLEGKAGFHDKEKRKTTVKNFDSKIITQRASAAVTIGDGKSQSLSKKSSSLRQKPNPASNIKSSDHKRLTNNAKKPTTPKSASVKSVQENRGLNPLKEDFGLEELIRASITEKHLSSDNLLPFNFWRNRNKDESNSSAAEEKIKSGRISSKVNFSSVQKRVSTGRKSGEKKTDPTAGSPAGNTEAKRNGKNVFEREKKFGDGRADAKSSNTNSLILKKIK